MITGMSISPRVIPKALTSKLPFNEYELILAKTKKKNPKVKAARINNKSEDMAVMKKDKVAM